MASANPNDFDFTQGQRAPIPTDRGPFVPPWYTPHANTALRVVAADGTPLPFRVGDVAPERRWAILEDGRIMENDEFRPLYDRWIRGQWEWQTDPDKRGAVNTEFDAIPNPVGFVAKQVDPANPARLCNLPMPQVPRTSGRRGPSNLDPIVDETITKGGGWTAVPGKEADEPTVETVGEKPPAETVECPVDGCGTVVKKRGLHMHMRQKHPVAGEA